MWSIGPEGGGGGGVEVGRLSRPAGSQTLSQFSFLWYQKRIPIRDSSMNFVPMWC